MNRYKRDEILHSALDMASIPTLDVRDRPQGSILPNALSIKWLQEGLDIFHHKFPWAGTVKEDSSITLASGSQDITLPSDFILDVRHGLLFQDEHGDFHRLFRFNFQRWLSFDLVRQRDTSAGHRPRVYAFMANAAGTAKIIKVSPKADKSYSMKLYYYALPSVLDSDTVPMFPVDHTLIEYVRIRAREWIGQFQPGVAQQFAEKEIARLQSAGLANEPEDDVIPYDEAIYSKFGHDHSNPWDWMGTWPQS